MKVIPIAAHYALAQTSLCTCLRLEVGEGSDTTVIGITTLAQELEVDGVVYRPGLDVTNLVSQTGGAVDNLDLTILPEEDELMLADLLAGRWDNARATIFEVNFRDPGAGINVLKRGNTGKASAHLSSWTVEFRSLKQALQQTITQVTQKTCRYRLGSTAMPDGLCFVDLGPFTVEGTATSVASNREFSDSTRTEDAEWFQEGFVTFLDGENAGYTRKVKTFSSGAFELSSTFPFAINVGDSYMAVAGCQKRLIEDCKNKFDNVLNFGGEPDIPGTDVLTGDPQIGEIVGG